VPTPEKWGDEAERQVYDDVRDLTRQICHGVAIRRRSITR
jgi:hypothetical protein